MDAAIPYVSRPPADKRRPGRAPPCVPKLASSWKYRLKPSSFDKCPYNWESLMFWAPAASWFAIAGLMFQPPVASKCVSTNVLEPARALELATNPKIVIRPADNTATNRIWLMRGNIVTSSCASQARLFHLGRLVFPDGSALAVPAQGGSLAATEAPRNVLGERLADVTLDGSSPVSTALVLGRGSSGGNYHIGAWNRHGVGTIAAFVEGAHAPPRVIATMHAEIKSISFFPSVDTPGGSIGLLLKGKDAWVVAHLCWYYNGWDWGS